MAIFPRITVDLPDATTQSHVPFSQSTRDMLTNLRVSISSGQLLWWNMGVTTNTTLSTLSLAITVPSLITYSNATMGYTNEQLKETISYNDAGDFKSGMPSTSVYTWSDDSWATNYTIGTLTYTWLNTGSGVIMQYATWS